MSDELEPQERNAQLKELEKLPPQLLEKVGKDPDESREYYRRISMITDHEMYQLRHQMTRQQLLGWAERWSKQGGMEPKKLGQLGDGSSGVSITINIPAIDNTPASTLTIEGSATPIDEPAPTFTITAETPDDTPDAD